MRARHGQATMELTLGALLAVTIILFGIHFAEVGFLSLKVQEAAAYANWEATGRRTQDLRTNDTLPFDAMLVSNSAIGKLATTTYEDFNGLTSVNNGNAVVVRALTQGSGVQVQCQENRALKWQPTPTAARAYADRGGFECTATATLKAVNFPINFLNAADGFFKAKNYDARGAAFGGQLKVCGVGRAVSGQCTGQMAVLLNDWGLAGDEEKGECRLQLNNSAVCLSNTGGSPPPPPNDTYHAALQRMWTPSFGKSKALAVQWAGSSPADPNEFWFSYSGLDSNYDTFVGGEGLPTFKTGGPGLGSIPDDTVKADCFLGKPGC